MEIRVPTGVRFAPSPTGRFHLGNLRTAWISHAWATALKEPWVVRFEDIDKPRVVSGAIERQLADLADLGLKPDEILLQSDRLARHSALFLKAVASGAVYPCHCSRKEVQEGIGSFASAPHGELPLYSGSCRQAFVRGENPEWATQNGNTAWRFLNADPTGRQDFIVGRNTTSDSSAALFTPSYHWACAVDDFDGNYRLIVRASDLETSTPLQRSIQVWMSELEEAKFLPPAVFHTSLVTQNDGQRLEKRTKGVTLDEILATGYSTPRVIELLQDSFISNSFDLIPGMIFSENEPKRTLESIGF